MKGEKKTVEQLCPVCGCTIVEGGHETEGVKYCCESCATAAGLVNVDAAILSQRAKRGTRLRIQYEVSLLSGKLYA